MFVVMDSNQQKVIDSEEKRIVVEAPAGYGKTTTMVKKIEKDIVNKNINNYSKILCLSFSIAASRKMKESLKNINTDNTNIGIIATNYHGFCRKILEKYGYLILGDKEFNLKTTVDSKFEEVLKNLSEKDKNFLLGFDNCIKHAKLNKESIEIGLHRYNQIIIKNYYQKGYITFNSIITLAIQLLLEHDELKKAYSCLFKFIYVDEFQDTNVLCLYLLNLIITDETHVALFGDPIQQIYKFAGSVPNILEKEATYLKAIYMELKTNYRFKNNKEMQLTDNYLRNLYKGNTLTNQKVTLKIVKANNQYEEAEKISTIIRKNPDFTYGILYRGQKLDSTLIIKKMIKHTCDKYGISYIDTTIDDVRLKSFQKEVFEKFVKYFSEKKINKLTLKSFLVTLRKKNYNKTYLALLKAFFMQEISSDLDDWQKKELVNEVLVHGELKIFISELNNNVTFSTIHGAKGLEWDYIFLVDFRQNSFPNYMQLDLLHMQSEKNIFSYALNNNPEFKILISEFYVAITRARKDYAVSYSTTFSYHKYNDQVITEKSNISCLASLPFFNKKIF